ncbi:acyl-CoA carboxylase subunit epsilon [Cellulomonas sp. H30R-01]|uniref:acyl-CoA carboxylase epsilon subunit n=1 Tax=Cellulomonas sp. H30R-01 TaxID=2704467 RepID=UPI00138B5652|nr:acyl-CoA carboxylase epsilon subunit [Cellulomonas sp. H30R-01]QHT54923.1 acyl-CoA carboxylase subunit epsilon [Cellulomonas sp. H30R-01]
MSEQSGAHVHVVRGAPDEVELAALVAGLVAASSQEAHGADEQAAATSAWSDRRRVLRGASAPQPGPDAWRWSLRG